MEKRVFLGLDGGGSKTAAVVVDASLNVLGEGLAGPSNHLRVGLEEATENVRKAIEQATRNAGVTTGQLEHAYCGIAGSDHPKHHELVVSSMREFFPLGNFTVDTDARVALTGAIGLDAGMVVIAGTGSVAFGRNGLGIEARTGGWGPTLGDEGSGYSIGRRGLSAVVKSFDRRGEKTLMSEILCSHFGMCHVRELPYLIYAESTHADDIALYFGMVIEAADQGDPVAIAIFESEGVELGKTALALAQLLELSTTNFPVACVGGAFRSGELLMGPFARTLLAGAAGARISRPTRSPVHGAAMMAIEHAENPRPGRSAPRSAGSES